MIRALAPNDAFRAIYRTLFLVNERHDRRSAPAAANDNWRPLGAA